MLDKNENRLIQKLTEALTLLHADEDDIKTIQNAGKIDDAFLVKAGRIFEETEACDVCRHAFHSWRNTLDDETVLSFIDDWIKWKKQNKDTSARIIKMRKRS